MTEKSLSMNEANPTNRAPAALPNSKLSSRLGFQAYLVIVMTTLVLIGTGAVMGEYYYQYGRSMASNLMDPGLFFVFLRSNAALMVKLVAFFFVVLAIAFVLSHRIAGPLERLSKGLEAAARGDLRQRLNVRKNDELVETTMRFNVMMEMLQRRLAEDRAAAQEVTGVLESLEKLNLPPEAAKALADAKAKAAALTKSFEI